MANLVVIQGCSRGFGKALLKASLSNEDITRPDSATIFVLLGTEKKRVSQAWDEVYREIYGFPSGDNQSAGRIEVHIQEADLTRLDECHRITNFLLSILQKLEVKIGSCYVFMNAGSVTPVGPLVSDRKSTVIKHSNQSSPADPSNFADCVVQHCHLNFISYVVILRTLIQHVVTRTASRSVEKVRIVNVTSLAALCELYGMAIYGAMKTAREAILRSLSREIQQDFPNLNMKVLNYAPGPMDTALVRNDLLGDDAPMNFVKSSSLSFVDEKESASKCINLITSPDLDFKWSSGDHIDFFDDL